MIEQTLPRFSTSENKEMSAARHAPVLNRLTVLRTIPAEEDPLPWRRRRLFAHAHAAQPQKRTTEHDDNEGQAN